MSTLEEIERAVADLSPELLAEFRAWFVEFDNAEWDAQIERDAASGKLDAIAAEALADHRAGRCRDL
jgi:hypothetical protein